MLGASRAALIGVAKGYLIGERPMFDTSLTSNSQTYSGDGYSVTGSAGGLAASGILGSVNSGAWYLEVYCGPTVAGNSFTVGWIRPANLSAFSREPTGTARTGWENYNGVQTRVWPIANGISLASGSILGLYIDIDGDEVKFFHNGTLIVSKSSVGLNFATYGVTLGFMAWDGNKYTLVDPASYSYTPAGLGLPSNTIAGWVAP